MAFVDKVILNVHAGAGGRGCVSFRREKFVPHGGPDGGDGGNGGNVILRTTTCVNDLSHLAGIPLFKAESGGHGTGAKCHGKAGRDLIIHVPQGTLVRDVSASMLLRDLDSLDCDLVVARRGRGGRGNSHFATPINQAPNIAEPGQPGEQRRLELELKLIADIGLVGLPNAGKSTLLSMISQARPKIAPYPFTTLYPQLGVTDVGSFGRLVIADIPGLIEGAHMGVGLGDEFLRHIERTRCLVHVVDAGAPNPVADYRTLRAELDAYGRGLPSKTVIICANKTDLPSAARGLKSLKSALGRGIIPVSALTGDGISKLITRLKTLLPPGRP